jgi:hypothetical protein
VAQDTTSAAPTTPPGTDIWLASLHQASDGTLTVGEPENVTDRPGYDNQPYFLPDGSGFWYTVVDDAGQADIWFYDLADRSRRQVTHTAPESEYSPTPMEGGAAFSAVRVEADSTQRLWRFDADGSNPVVLFPDIMPVGYHAWADDSTAALYVLGDPPTLHVARLGKGDEGVAARDIGRSLQSIPGTHAVSYVQRVADGGTEIHRLDPATGDTTFLVAGVQGGDFHAWTPGGRLLQAHEGRIYAWMPGSGMGWSQIADLSSLGIRLSRMAVSPDGTLIALVGEGGG